MRAKTGSIAWFGNLPDVDATRAAKPSDQFKLRLALADHLEEFRAEEG